MPFRIAASGLIVLAAFGAATVVLGSSVDPLRLARWLNEHGGPEYPLWIGWTLLAPLVLLGAAVGVRRTPWPWVVLAAVEVLSVALAVARFAHLAPWWAWLFLALVMVSGAVSIVGVGADDAAGRAET